MRIHIMRNRTLSAVLVICLILSMAPVIVSADDTPDTTAPTFNDGPKEHIKGDGSKRLILTTGPLSEPSFIYFVVVANGSGKPSAEQVKEGQDSTGKAALYSGGTTEHTTINAIYNFSFPMAEDNMEYDAYFLLEDASGNKTLSDTLTVKTPGERTLPLCEYSGTPFTKIEDAISQALNNGGGTIKLLDGVDHNKAVVIDKPVSINFDINGKYFSIYTDHIPGSTALTVSNGGSVTYSGDDDFYVTGAQYGVKVIGNNSSATVSCAYSIEDDSIAASTDIGSTITINGDVEAGKDSTGVSSYGNVVVNGNIEVKGGYSTGAYANYKGVVIVNGDIISSGTRAVGAFASGEEAHIDVNGKITVSGGNSTGALASNGGKISVSNSGSAISLTGDHSCGISVHNMKESKVTVSGNVEVTGDGANGINASFGEVTVNGDVTVNESYVIGVQSYDYGFVKINGNVNATGKEATGIYACIGEGAGGIVHVDGDVNVSSPYEDSIGVSCSSRNTLNNKSMVTVDGKVNADDKYIYIDDIFRTSDSEDDIENGYWVYNGKNGSIVKIGNDEVVEPTYTPTVVTNAVTGIKTSSAILSGNVTSDGGDTVMERGFLFGTDSGLTTSTAINAGSGTGTFAKTITGLEENITYYVRAYAANSNGMGYGTIVSFIVSNTPVNPPTPGKNNNKSVITKKSSVPETGEIGWLDASGIDLSNPYGNVVLYTDEDGVQNILGLGIIVGDQMKYISRGQGKYEIIYNAKPFDDIAGHWAKNDIDFSSARLLFNGITPRIFSPDTHMSRGMFATVLGRMYGADPEHYEEYSFEDVPQDMYYAPYVKWAADNGLVFGVSASSFEPERAVTRQEMAAMMFRFMKHLGLDFTNDNNEFIDDAFIDSWAKESIMQLKGTGIISGRTDNKFDPYDLSTRAEVAAVMRRLIEYILK